MNLAAAPPRMFPLAFSDFSLVTCLGAGRDATLTALLQGRSGLNPCSFADVPFATYAGEVEGLDEHPLRSKMSGFDCRNNRLAARALMQDGFLDSLLLKER